MTAATENQQPQLNAPHGLASGAPTRISLPPSPHKRLLAGVALLLVLFLAFGVYTVVQMRHLTRYQRQVLERNRRDTLQLLRIQQDVYALSESVTDMVSQPPPPPPGRQARHPSVPIPVWRDTFQRLRVDLNQALAEEASNAPAGRSQEQREQFRRALAGFWTISHQVFVLAGQGYEAQAGDLVRRELQPQRGIMHHVVARWLNDNDLHERSAEAAMQAIYARIERSFLWLTLLLVVTAAAIAAWALRANRASFARIQALNVELDRHGQQLEELSWRYLQIQEETLHRVSRDLHDEFGQILTALGALLARSERQAQQSSAAPGLAPSLHEARAIVQQAQQQIRTLSQLLHPTLLDDFGLEATLEWSLNEYRRASGLEVAWQRQGELPFLPSETAIHLYRIVQEALTNIQRHAQASHVWVALRADAEGLELTVEDDGVGLTRPAEISPPGHGVGLPGMRERAERLGGTFRLSSPPPERPQGTQIRVSLPPGKPLGHQAAK